MNKTYAVVLTVVGVVLALGSMAVADVNIETVPVGNAGNTGESSGSGNYGPRICGAVDYEYNIGKYEVTAGQYCEFLNTVAATDIYGLYDPNMDSNSYGCQITQNGVSGSYTYDFSGRPSGTEADWSNRPVNYVNFWNACRFANWLHNGQGSGDTETGAYTLADGSAITRNTNWKWAVTSEDEWYKAAYHKNDGVTGNYYDYPTGSDTMPGNDLVEPTDPGNNATFDDGDYTIGSPYWRTEVGAHENSESPYGTFDQGGNLWEWNESIGALGAGGWRCLRSGSIINDGNCMHAAFRDAEGDMTPGYYYVGFRVSEVPEPASMVLLALGGIGILMRRRGIRKNSRTYLTK